jgi:hypothetical protein
VNNSGDSNNECKHQPQVHWSNETQDQRSRELEMIFACSQTYA